MYTLIRTHARDKNGWHVINSGPITIEELKTKYTEIFIYIQTDNLSVKLLKLHNLYNIIHINEYGYTIDSFIANRLTDDLLSNTSDNVTLDKVGKMSVRDLWDLPLNIEMGNHIYGEDIDIPIGSDIDMVLSSIDDDVNYIGILAENFLFAINGRVLEHKRVGDRLYIVNARRHISTDKHSNYSATALDFTELSKVEWITITNDNSLSVNRTEKDIKLKRTRIKVNTNTDLTNKTILLVIDGYPHFLDGLMYAYDANTIFLDIDHRRTCKRMVIDGAEYWVGANSVNIRNTGLDMETVDIHSFITSGTSAIIILDNDDVNRLTSAVGRTDIIGMYTFPYVPQGMLVLDDGIMADYLVMGYDGTQATLTVSRGILKEYMHDTVDYHKNTITTATEIKTRVPLASTARMVDLYTTRPR